MDQYVNQFLFILEFVLYSERELGVKICWLNSLIDMFLELLGYPKFEAQVKQTVQTELGTSRD